MPWSELEDTDGKGQKSCYQGHGFTAQLDFDCHGDARKLEVRPTGESRFVVPTLLEHLKPFAAPVVVVPEQLAIVDRPRYFRLYVSPVRLQAQLRKEAPLSVISELLTQIERAQTAATCSTCPSLCPAAALSYRPEDGSLHIDSRRCTHCLDCVHHHRDETRLPPTSTQADAVHPAPEQPS